MKARAAVRAWRGEIDDCPPSANVYQRLHWSDRHPMIARWYLEIYVAFKGNWPTRATGKRRVRIVIRSKRERDHANLWLGADKLILDNLVKLGWLVDDKPSFLDATVRGEVGQPRTVIFISEVQA